MSLIPNDCLVNSRPKYFAILARAEALPTAEFGHTDEVMDSVVSNALTKLQEVEAAIAV